MKKIAILTWLNNENYGSVLQAFALQKFLINNDYNVIDINYNPNLFSKLSNWFKSGNSPRLFIDKFQKKFNKYKGKTNVDFNERSRKFNDFKNKYIAMTEEFDSTKQLKKLTNLYDVYICGSDQIWSPKLLNPVFFFSFLKKEDYRISYAPSMGVNTITNKKEKVIKKYLTNFNHISVREEQGKLLLNRITNKKIDIVVDPTFLLKKSDWEQIISEINYKNYIFVYLLRPNKSYIDSIKKYASKNNYKVIICQTDIGPFNTNCIEINNAGPDDWLSYIYNANIVFTDSLHASIFSIIFNKNFYILKRFNDNDKLSENSRINHLVKKYKLEERYLDKITDINEEIINYNYINKKIKAETDVSKKWLINSIEDQNE